METQLLVLACKKKNPYSGLDDGTWQIHLRGGEGRRLSPDSLLPALMPRALQGISVMQRAPPAIRILRVSTDRGQLGRVRAGLD